MTAGGEGHRCEVAKLNIITFMKWDLLQDSDISFSLVVLISWQLRFPPGFLMNDEVISCVLLCC